MEATVVTDFSEMAIRGPRPGFFVGDCFIEPGSDGPGAVNPITRQYELDVNGIPHISQSSPALGSLSHLPIEILHHILAYLDILSVLEVFRVNQKCVAVVKSSQDFETIATFPKALSAAVHMRCRFYSIGRLAACIRDIRCSRCEGGHFGELLYLITAERVCWSCWRRLPDYLPIIKDERTAKVPVQVLSVIPHVVGVPGRYGELGHWTDPFPSKRINSYGRIYDRRAFMAAFKSGGYGQGTDLDKDPDPEPERAPYRSPKSQHQASYYGRYPRSPLTLRRIAFIRAPYWDQEMQSFVGGYFCRACIGRDNFDVRYRYDDNWKFPESIWHEPWRRYTRKGFWTHIERYGRILRSAAGAFVHDSPRQETQTPDDVQFEMYRHEKLLLADGMDLPDDQPMSNPGHELPHNCK